MEASTFQLATGVARARTGIGSPLLCLRSDQQLVASFRAGNDDAFRIIHDRYRPRLLAYVRQMLSGQSSDAEDALQDVFIRAYAGLRTSDRELALRPWLYRVAHNRCVDELRRSGTPQELVAAYTGPTRNDPATEAEQRESLPRLLVDIRRLPEQQRSALLMRELSGMTYADVAAALGVSVPAVKSLLVRARVGLSQALEARTVACAEIRRQLAEAHGRGVRPSWMARRHLRDCPACRACRAELRAFKREFAALVPTLGPLGLLAKLFGTGGGAGGGAAAGAGGGTAAASAGGIASGLAGVSATHVAALLAAAAVTAGGALELQRTVATTHAYHNARHAASHAASSALLGTRPLTRAPQMYMRAPALAPARWRTARSRAAPAGTASSSWAPAAQGQSASNASAQTANPVPTVTQPTGPVTAPATQPSAGMSACQTLQPTAGQSCQTGTATTTTVDASPGNSGPRTTEHTGRALGRLKHEAPSTPVQS